MESFLDLGMSFSSPVGHNGHKMPPKHSQIVVLKEPCWLKAAPTKITSWPLQAANPQHSLKGVQGGIQKKRHPVLWEKPRRTGLQIVRCFQVKILWALILASSCTQRNTNAINQGLVLLLLVSPEQLFCFYSSLGHIPLTFLLSLFLLEYRKSPSTTRISLSNT